MKTDVKLLRDEVRMVNSIYRSMQPKSSSRHYSTHSIQIPVRDGSYIAAKIHQPRGKMPLIGCPCMYLCHGGGYVLGDIENEESLGELFTSLGGVAIDVIYRNAPEFPFPIPVMDSYDGLKWVGTH
jgi:acetyl esterase/lipase